MHSRILAAAVAVTFVLSFVPVAPAVAQTIVNPRITTDSSIDCSSAEAVVKQILKPGMTDEQKAVACWKFMLDHFYHWFPPCEDNSPEPVRDFAKAVNSYGYGPCFVNAPILTDLWEAAGFKTRSWTITGHSIPEVFYGGVWHMLDADARAWHRKADGQIASVEELAGDMTLFTNPKEKSDPFYPFGAPDAAAAPLIPWGPPSKMMDLYRSRGDNYRYNKRAVFGHPMYVALRQGETLSYGRENVGKWFVFDKLPKDMMWKNPPAAAVKLDKGPVEIAGKYTYGNGSLVWQPNLNRIRPEDLLWMGSENVQLKDGKLAAVDAAKPAVAVFRTFCPWVLVEATARIVCAGKGTPKVEVSHDGGFAWTKPATLPDSLTHGYSLLTVETPVDGADPKIESRAGRYEYLVRVTLADGPITSVSFENVFTVAQLSLPVIQAGKNTVTVFRGPDEGVVQLTLIGNKAAKDRYVIEAKGLNTPNALTAAKKEEPGYVVFKIVAPDALKAISMGGNISISRGPIPFVQAEYSADAGRTWTKAFRLEKNSNNDNTQMEEDVKVDLAGNTSKSAFVKFTIAGDSQHGPGMQYGGLDTLRLYGYYQLPQPKGVKLAVDLVWQEKAGDQWQDKKVRQIVDEFPQEFRVDAGGQQARFKSVTFAHAE